jgi:hypothetical protein
LLGEWQGQAITLYADLSQPNTYNTYLKIKQQDSNHIVQSLSFGDQTISSTAIIAGNKLLFENSGLPTQILLLPDGASCNCPLEVKLGHNFVLEMGWLLQPQIRQRIIRSYNAKGNWVSCTLVTEKKLVN